VVVLHILWLPAFGLRSASVAPAAEQQTVALADALQQAAGLQDSDRLKTEAWCRDEIADVQRQLLDFTSLQSKVDPLTGSQAKLSALTQRTKELVDRLAQRKAVAQEAAASRERAAAVLGSLEKRVAALSGAEADLAGDRTAEQGDLGSSSATALLDDVPQSEGLRAVRKLLKEAQEKLGMVQEQAQPQKAQAAQREVEQLEDEYRQAVTELSTLRVQQNATQENLDLWHLALEDNAALLTNLRSICRVSSKVYRRIDSEIRPALSNLVEQLATREGDQPRKLQTAEQEAATPEMTVAAQPREAQPRQAPLADAPPLKVPPQEAALPVGMANSVAQATKMSPPVAPVASAAPAVPSAPEAPRPPSAAESAAPISSVPVPAAPEQPLSLETEAAGPGKLAHNEATSPPQEDGQTGSVAVGRLPENTVSPSAAAAMPSVKTVGRQAGQPADLEAAFKEGEAQEMRGMPEERQLHLQAAQPARDMTGAPPGLRGGWQSFLKKKKVKASHPNTVLDLVQTPVTYATWHPDKAEATELAAKNNNALLAAERAFDAGEDDDEKPAAFLQLQSESQSKAQAVSLVLRSYSKIFGSTALLQLSSSRLSDAAWKSLWEKVKDNAASKQNDHEAKELKWCRDFERDVAATSEKRRAAQEEASVGLATADVQRDVLEQRASAQSTVAEALRRNSDNLRSFQTRLQGQQQPMAALLQRIRQAPQVTATAAPREILETIGRLEGLLTASTAEVQDVVEEALDQQEEAEKLLRASQEQLKATLLSVDQKRAQLAAVSTAGESSKSDAGADDLRGRYADMCRWTLQASEEKDHKDEGTRLAIHDAFLVQSAQ